MRRDSALCRDQYIEEVYPNTRPQSFTAPCSQFSLLHQRSPSRTYLHFASPDLMQLVLTFLCFPLPSHTSPLLRLSHFQREPLFNHKVTLGVLIKLIYLIYLGYTNYLAYLRAINFTDNLAASKSAATAKQPAAHPPRHVRNYWPCIHPVYLKSQVRLR